MRWFAAATVTLALLGAVFGCGSDGGGNPVGALGGAGGGAGDATAGSDVGVAGKGGASPGAGSGGTAGSPVAVGGDAGSLTAEGGSAGADEAMAGAAPGGSSGSGGTAGTGGAPAVPTVPAAPTALTLHVLNSTSVQLGWTDNANNETGYNVYWSATTDKPAMPNAMVAPNVITDTVASLTVNQEYNFWVEAYNDVGASTDITGKATPIPVPAAPTGLVVTAGATDAVLTWSDAAVGETGYRVYVSDTNTQPTDALPDVIAANATTFTVTSAVITPYTKYYYWVVAYNAIGESAPATGSGTTGVAPIAPNSVAVDPSASIWSVAVSWIDNSTNANSFNVYWSTDDTKPALPGASVTDGSNSYKLKTVQGNKTYRFWVESVNVIGTSSATKGTATQPTYELAWTDLYYDTASNTIRQAVADTFGLLTDAEPASKTGLYGYHGTTSALPTVGASSLTPGINWNPTTAGIDTTVTQYFYAEARTPLGSQFSVRSLVPPSALTGLSVVAAQLTASLSWSASTNVQSYQVYMATGAGAALANATLYTTTTTAPTAGAPLVVSDLNPGTAYSFWVRSLGVGINGTGLPSAFATQAVTTTGTAVGPNIALGKTAVASSSTADQGKVVDGRIDTRWQAATKTPGEWIYVNLGNGNDVNITHVKLVWEAAYATTFDIQVCPGTCDDVAATPVDSWAWVTAYSSPSVQTLTGFPNYQMVTLTTPTVGQFIRMKVKTLPTAGAVYPASLWEFEVFSAP